MRKHIVNEFEVATSADTLWAIYSTPQFPKLIVELLPTIYQKKELIEGDGSPGTVFNVTFVSGMFMPSYKGKLVTIDHENRLKEVEHVEGGYLELGCSYYMNSFQIMEKDCDSCIIKFTVTYELAKDVDPNVDDLVNNFTIIASVAQAMSKYVLDKKGAAAHNYINQYSAS